MRKLQKLFCLCLALLLVFPALPVGADALQGESHDLIQDILGSMLREDSPWRLRSHLQKLEKADPDQARIWEAITTDWTYINEEMVVNENVLPDGLPQDDSLAIVVLGYRLNDNGSMTPELLDRLGVAIRSARKYPNAYIICTGGATSRQESMTEAGEMARWLTICGIEEDRIIVEDASYSTTENARNTCEILRNGYGQIRSLAIVTSDYHIRRSCLMFSAAAQYAPGADGELLQVVANAVCPVEGSQEESLRTKVWGLAILAGVEMPE